MAIKRNTLVSPFSVRTPFLDKNSEHESGVSWPHTKTMQSIITAVNAAPQIAASIPASSASRGEAGTIAFDANFIYIAVAANTWRRASLVAF